MRIRLSLQLDVTRDRQPGPDEFEHRDQDAAIERAEPQRIGFHVDHGAEPDEDEGGGRRR